MKIIVDGRCLTGKATGVSNYLIDAINSLSKFENFEFYILSHKKIQSEVTCRFYEKSKIKFIEAPFYLFKKNGLIWFFFKLPFLVNSLEGDIFWGPGQVLPFFLKSCIKKMVTIHDFVFIYYSYTMSIKSWIENKVFTSQSIKKSDYIWCVSDYTKNELIKLYPNRKCNTIFVGSGIDFSRFRKMFLSEEKKKEIISKYNVSNPFILCVGTLEPRKNFQFLLQLMPRIVSEKISLLVVGSKGWGKSIKVAPEESSYVKYTGYVDIEELVMLYNIADLYVSSSLNEGFGLPILEAVVCGCPILTPYNSAMIELGSTFGTTVTGWDEDVWVESILKLIQGDKVINQNNREELLKYDWDIIARGFKDYLDSDV
ncbi:glycosyltransferase family 4 protein [Flavobacterium fluviatile]|uniref:glycosyltransferase family 4 protein n=1 Tax=Flavobacterium fluviatile TaxID=1862387 RepID=UPI0013D3658C|nr:glycosyltransferase family 1 protein [Flavobacterium fluviatile]